MSVSGHVTIPLKRAWYSWSPRPAELVFLPLGLKITPVLFSTRLGKTSFIEPRRQSVRFGRHSIDNALMELETEFAGSTVALRAGATEPFAIRGEWDARELAEWGARFWLCLAISADGAETIRHDGGRSAIVAKIDRRFVAIVARDAPILVSGHETLDALAGDLEENGYFHTGSRSEAAPVLAMRFNMEMTRRGAYAAAVADSEDMAIENARAALEGERATLPALHEGDGGGALDAMRDIVGWNTVWDATNHRPYTTVTRIWNLGTFAVWYNDQTYAALLSGVFDADLARDNMAAAHAGATPQGNIACIVTSNDAWVDRGQPPLGSLTAWLLYQRTRERSLLDAHYETLARNQRWWRANRDPEGAGLLSCGTSDVGDALYKSTHFGARNETGMDNSATHDEATYDPATRTLSTFDLGLNCAVALDAEMLSLIAGELDRAEEADEFARLAEASRDLIRTLLWDDERKIFANRQRDGGFVRSLSPTSFYPLLCGAATTEQAAELLRHLDDPATFDTPFVLPNATRDDPAYAENVYWRGRIWPNVNYLVWLGLRRYGFAEQAGRLATRSYDLFMRSWREDRVAAENYNAETGQALDQGDADPFYIWSALLPMMAVEQAIGFDPWEGWTIANGPDCRIGPLLSPLGQVTLERRGNVVSVCRSGIEFLSTDVHGRLSRVMWSEGHFHCTVETDEACRLTLAQVRTDRIVEARLAGSAIPVASSGSDSATFHLPAGPGGRMLEIWFSHDER